MSRSSSCTVERIDISGVVLRLSERLGRGRLDDDGIVEGKCNIIRIEFDVQRLDYETETSSLRKSGYLR